MTPGGHMTTTKQDDLVAHLQSDAKKSQLLIAFQVGAVYDCFCYLEEASKKAAGKLADAKLKRWRKQFFNADLVSQLRYHQLE